MSMEEHSQSQEIVIDIYFNFSFVCLSISIFSVKLTERFVEKRVEWERDNLPGTKLRAYTVATITRQP